MINKNYVTSSERMGSGGLLQFLNHKDEESVLGINVLEPKCGPDLQVTIGDDGWIRSDFVPYSVVVSHYIFSN